VNTQPDNLTVRLAAPDDAHVLAGMLQEFAAFERLPNASTEESLRQELSGEAAVLQAVIAFIDGEPVGFATFFQTYSTFAAKRGLYLEDIFVPESQRNKGIATAILRFLARLAVEKKFGRVEFTVLLWNNIAIEFFEGLGATPNSAWTTYRLSGEWLEKLAAV
jgi:GNAT superfamily N-acetyltransferase